MKLAFFVHDFHLEIGHTNAMVEVLRHWQGPRIEQLDVISYTFTPPQDILPEYAERIIYHHVPLPWLKPFILKVIWYHMVSGLWSLLRFRHHLQVGIGTAALNVDVVNVQFVHHQWRDHYLALQRQVSWFRWLYKRILFSYLTWSERVLYRRTGVSFATCARFIQDYMQATFCVPDQQIMTAYSGINLERFQLSGRSRASLIAELKDEAPGLERLDLERPIILFVGALERKGLPKVLKECPRESQLVVVGRTELSEGHYRDLKEQHPQVVFVSHTRRIARYYELADAFVFPSLYDPFGLVVLEAAAMGLQVFVSATSVGASELLHGLSDIWLLDLEHAIPFDKVRCLTSAEKEGLRRQRLEHLGGHTWKKAAKDWAQLLANRMGL